MKEQFIAILLNKALSANGLGLHGVLTSSQKDEPSDNLILMSGENASGKSIISRSLAHFASDHEIFYREVSMGDRNGKTGYMRQVRDFGRYGDEDQESTGYLTIKRIIKDRDFMLSTDKDFIFTIDEAELGLSEEYHAALGQLIAEAHIAFAATGRCKMFLVCSHSKTLLSSLTRHLDYLPASLHLSMKAGSQTHYEWLRAPIRHRSIDELITLPERALEKRKHIAAASRELKAKK